MSVLRNKKIVFAAAGVCHTIFVDSNGRVFTCGKGSGQLGHGDIRIRTVPTAVASLEVGGSHDAVPPSLQPLLTGCAHQQGSGRGGTLHLHQQLWVGLLVRRGKGGGKKREPVLTEPVRAACMKWRISPQS